MELIDKDALVAEIEKRITNIKEYCVRKGHDRRFDVVSEQLSQILAFINTLEVKEVDLESNSFDATVCKLCHHNYPKKKCIKIIKKSS